MYLLSVGQWGQLSQLQGDFDLLLGCDVNGGRGVVPLPQFLSYY